MEMDRRSILAVVLSIGTIILWAYIFPPSQQVQDSQPASQSIPLVKETDPVMQNESATQEKEIKADGANDALSENAKPITATTFLVTIEDENIKRIITNANGVRFNEYSLKKHIYNAARDVSLISRRQNNGLNLNFRLTDGRTFSSLDMDFILIDSIQQTLELSETYPKRQLRFVAYLDERPIYQTYTFYYDQYHFDVVYDLSSISSQLSDNTVNYQWKNGTPYTEANPFEDENMSLVFLEGEDDFYRFDTEDPESETFQDPKYFHFFAIRNKYFVNAVIPLNFKPQIIKAENIPFTKDEVTYRRYKLDMKSDQAKSEFRIYSGPIEKKELDKYEEFRLENIYYNASGYESLFSIFVIPVHWTLVNMNSIIGSYGISIILFTILLKLLLFPLTKKSYQGMSGMKALQPKMAAIKEKFKGDQQRIQQQMMKLYKEEKVNPAAGCLPMLLQMPLLFSLFITFRSMVELRGASFLWIENMAAPDAFPIGLAVIGFETINLLPILMAVSQIFASKQTITDPNQKMMIYMMPVMMLFLFYNWSAGLNFYYLLFNVFTSIQQHMIHAPEKKNEKNGEVISPDGFKLNEKIEQATPVKKPKKNMYKKKKK